MLRVQRARNGTDVSRVLLGELEATNAVLRTNNPFTLATVD